MVLFGSFIVVNNRMRNKFRTAGIKQENEQLKSQLIDTENRLKSINEKPTEKPTEKSEEQKTSDTANSDASYELQPGNYEIPRR